MREPFLKLVFAAALAVVSTWAHAFPAPLPTPDLAQRDFRSGTSPVAPSSIQVAGLGLTGIYVVGAFDSVDGQSRPHGIARLHVDGSLDTAWSPALPYYVAASRAAEGHDGRVALAYPVNSGGIRDAVVLVLPGLGTGTTIHTFADESVQAFTFDPQGALFVATGRAPTFGAYYEAHVLRFGATGTPDSAFALRLMGDYGNCSLSGIAAYVSALSVLDGQLYVVGNFLHEDNPRGSWHVGGALRVSAATGDADTTWYPMGLSTSPASGTAEPKDSGEAKLTCVFNPTGAVDTILPGPNSTVYLVGPFQRQGRTYLARFQRAAPGNVDPSWTPVAPYNSNSKLNAALDPTGGFLYVAGDFEYAGEVNRNGLVAYSTSDGSVHPAWDPNAPKIRHIASASDRLLVAGMALASVHGTPRAGLAGLPHATTAAPTEAVITVAPRFVDFGVVPIDTTASRDIAIGNAGGSPLAIQDIAFSIPAGIPHAISATHDCGMGLAPGATCTIRLALDPDISESVSGTRVTITSNGSGTPQVVSVAWRAGYPILDLPGAGYFECCGFESTPVGYTRSKTLVVRNEGNLPLELTSIVVSNASGPASFSKGGDCPASLAPAASCNLVVSFTPSGSGASTGRLTFTFGTRTHVNYTVINNWVSSHELTFPGLGAGPGDDSDGDGMPNAVEASEGRNPLARDNDVFASNRFFAMQQYRDFLAREGDAGGIAYWAGQLDSGAATRAMMAEAFLASPEFQGAIAPMVRLYFAYFLRIPDYAGLNYWIGQYRGGQSLQAISDAFAAGPEFVSRYGSLDNGQFVDRVYRNVLGRAPDAAGLAHWTGQLESGATTRGQLMIAFSESAEYRALAGTEVLVTMAYAGMLRRTPDSSGFSSWVSYVDQGNSPLALIAAFVAAAEYRNRFLP